MEKTANSHTKFLSSKILRAAIWDMNKMILPKPLGRSRNELSLFCVENFRGVLIDFGSVGNLLFNFGSEGRTVMQFSQLCFLTTLLILRKSPSSCPKSRMVNFPHERGIEITLLKVLVYLYKWDQETNHGSKSEVAARIVSHRYRHIGRGFGET